MSESPSLRLRVARRLGLAPPAPPPGPAVPTAPADRADAAFLLDDPWFRSLLASADARLAWTPSEMRPALFAGIPLDVFALLALHRPAAYPALAAWLPAMPPREQQIGMTGAEGQQSMLEAAAFVRAAVAAVGGPQALLSGRVLDYGIGWGRIARLFYRYVQVERIFGVDAWPDSVALTHATGFAGPLATVESIPESLPFAGPFDLVTAFSVFTHLREDAALAAAAAIRASLRPGGVFAVTIRPSGYTAMLGERAPAHAEALERTGFAFTPDAFAVEIGEPYGNASMTVQHLLGAWRGFELVGVEASGFDPYQLYVLLRAV